MEEIKILPCHEGFKMPEKATPRSCAYDVYVPERYKLKFGRQVIPLGFKMEMPINIKANNRPRSGYSAKGVLAENVMGTEIRIDADVELGLIDSDYRGECGTILVVRDERVKSHDYFLPKHLAISQMEFAYKPETTLSLADALSDTQRGEKGFGEANNE